jgi:hypothetical protein
MMHLSDIDFARLQLVKEVVRWYGDQDHSRWIFAGSLDEYRESRAFVKVWNPTYVRRDNVVRGIEVGFYDARTTPALQALIFDAGVCRGYVMARCRRHRRLDPGFYDLICTRTAETGHFAVQFSAAHSMRYDNRFSLIDLEGIYPVEQLALVAAHHSAFAHAPYAEFVAGLFDERCLERKPGVGGGSAPPVEDPPRWLRNPARKAFQVWKRSMEWARARTSAHTPLIEGVRSHLDAVVGLRW